MMTSSGVAASVIASIASVGFFEVVWVIGMEAMMFSAMISKVLSYDKVKAKLETNPFSRNSRPILGLDWPGGTHP